MTTLEHALLLYDAGFNIMPLDGKKPVGDWKELQFKRAGRERIERYFTEHPNKNIAVICGKVSGVTVVDIDVKETSPTYAEEQEAALAFIKANPTPMIVRTGSGGFHLYYAVADVSNMVKIPGFKFAMDIRSQGGYVVAPPSVHPTTGRTYAWWSEDPEADIDTEALLSLRENLPAFPPLVANRADAMSRKLPEDWEKIVLTTGEGGRNQALVALCGKFLRAFPPRDWEPILRPLLWLWNTNMVKPPLDQLEFDRTFDSIAKKELRTRTLAGHEDMERV